MKFSAVPFPLLVLIPLAACALSHERDDRVPVEPLPASTCEDPNANEWVPLGFDHELGPQFVRAEIVGIEGRLIRFALETGDEVGFTWVDDAFPEVVRVGNVASLRNRDGWNTAWVGAREGVGRPEVDPPEPWGVAAYSQRSANPGLASATITMPDGRSMARLEPRCTSNEGSCDSTTLYDLEVTYDRFGDQPDFVERVSPGASIEPDSGSKLQLVRALTSNQCAAIPNPNAFQLQIAFVDNLSSVAGGGTSTEN